MDTKRILFESELPVSWHLRKGAMERLVPPWAHVSIDEISSIPPFFFPSKTIDAQLLRYFAWRNRILKEDLQTLEAYPQNPLRILMSGASGFIGSHLKVFLELAGHEVIRLVRDKTLCSRDALFWDPVQGEVKKQDFEGFDAVIHLAGAGISEKRWTAKTKEQLLLSRSRDTWLLSQILCRLYRPPKTLLCASAVGFYGDRKEEELTEQSRRGEGFLPSLCEKWERATEAIENRGTRVMHLRFGAVLGAKGGLLHKMLPLYRLGLGGKMGSGEQILSWIGIDDALGAIYHCLMKEKIEGPVNLVAPETVDQQTFARLLGQRMGRPLLCPLPSPILKLILGEFGRDVILASQNAKPIKLLETGYKFRYSDLKTALDFVI